MAIPAVLASPLLVPGLFTFVIIALWASNRLPEYLTALMFFAGAMMLHLAPPERVFAGFGSSAFWLVLSGFVIGSAIRSVGLADRVARMLAVPLAGSWLRMLVGVVALTYALAFVMPSNMGRMTLLMPIMMALAERSGLAEGSKGRIALALAVGFGTFQLSTSISPAWVGLAAACLCLLPRIGFLTGDQFAAGVNVRTYLYIAGILGLAAVVSSSGLGNAVGQALLRVLPLSPDHPRATSPRCWRWSAH